MLLLHPFACALVGAAILAMASWAPPAHAAAADYRFERVQAQAAGPGKTTLTIRLMHVPDSKPVEGAVLFETKADMGPAGMPDMAGKITALPSDKPGLYRFQAETGMAGKWQLVLGAKVQGEPETVRGTVPFEAGK